MILVEAIIAGGSVFPMSVFDEEAILAAYRNSLNENLPLIKKPPAGIDVDALTTRGQKDQGCVPHTMNKLLNHVFETMSSWGTERLGISHNSLLILYAIVIYPATIRMKFARRIVPVRMSSAISCSLPQDCRQPGPQFATFNLSQFLLQCVFTMNGGEAVVAQAICKFELCGVDHSDVGC